MRIDKKIEKLVHSSFNDFKLLGALGAVVGVGPVLTYLEGSNKGALLRATLLACLAAFGVLAIVAFRDLLKQSLIAYLIREQRIVARQLGPSTIFRAPHRWARWHKRRYSPLMTTFYGLVAVACIALPGLALGWGAEALAFVVIVAVVCVLFGCWGTRVSRSLEPTQTQSHPPQGWRQLLRPLCPDERLPKSPPKAGKR